MHFPSRRLAVVSGRFGVRPVSRGFAPLAAAVVLALAARSGFASAPPDSGDPRSAGHESLAPVEVVASGLAGPRGVAVAPDGTVFFTDEKRGELFEVGSTGGPRLLASGLKKPRGVAWEDAGHLLLLAERLGNGPRGLLLRFELESRALTVLAQGLEHPRGLARTEAGVVYVSSDGLRGPGDDGDEDDEDNDEDYSGTILRWNSTTGLVPLATGFKQPDGLVALDNGTLLVAAGEHKDGAGVRLRGSVFAVDSTGAVSVRLTQRLKHPSGLVQDVTGALFVGGERHEGHHSDVIVKLVEGTAHDFATGLDRPRGMAFSGSGDLIAAHTGAILRYRAPGKPTLDLVSPAATNQEPFSLRGSAEVGTQVWVLGVAGRLTAVPGADGRFAIQVPLPQNQETHLRVPAVGADGLGLASAPAAVVVTHDDIPPTITASLDRPPNAAGWHSADITVTFTCVDGGAGIAACPGPAAVATEGAGQVVSGTAVDRAGNSTTTSASVSLDKTPPSVMAGTGPPPNAAGWNKSDVVVAAVCFDALSGVAACPSPLAVTSEGTNQIVTSAATDLAGNSATAGVTLNIDKTPPTVTASVSPVPNAQQWNNTDATVSFEAQDALSGLAAVSPAVTVTTEGMSQSVSGTATDRAGNTGSAAALVSIDKTPPAVGIESPVEGTIRRVPTVRVNGTATDANPLTSITVNGVEVGASSPYSTQVTLGQEGAQSLTTVARDVAGNSATASVGIVYSSPPVVKITSPADLTALGTTPITVSGTLDDPGASIKVGIEGVPAAVSGNTFTATGVSLREGGNVITAVATDAFGNAATDSITVVLDTAAPRVMIDSPPDGSVTTSPTITVSGRVNDIVLGTVNTPQAQVTVNGIPAAVAYRSFVAEGISLVPGLNTITAMARDAVGNSDTKTITLHLDTVPGPRVTAVAGSGQTAGIGTPLPQPLVVSLTDAAGTPLAGRTVLFRVSQNSGVLLDGASQPLRGLAMTTDVDGKAQARFIVGSRAGVGNNRVEATSPGITGAAVFLASATSQPPAKISLDAGNLQKGEVGRPLPRPFVAVATDEGHNRLPGVPVTFTVVLGDGNFNGASSVTVNSDSDGRALAVLTLGPQPGLDNNAVEASVAEPGVFPAGFVASAVEPGDPAQTRISGVVLDNANVPIPGVTLRIRGTALAATADAQGQFVVAGVPVGDVHLHVDGSTAQRPGTWPDLEYELVTVAGANNTLGMPIYLLPLDTAYGIFVDETKGGTLLLPDVPGFSLTVAPNSATFPDGTRRGTITVTPVHPDKVPMVPNFGQQPRFIVTIQPPGVKFYPPAAVTHPNVDGLAPGQVTELYSFDHDMGSFVATGTATVSEDGTVLRSDPGVGVVKGGWHCGGDPAGAGTTHNCPECQKCVTTNCQPDDSQTPTQKAPDDCKKEVCRGGAPSSDPNDSEKPEDEPGNCKEEICKGGSPDSKPDDADAPPGPFQKCCDGEIYDVDTEGCCSQQKFDRYSQCCDSGTVKPSWPIANIDDPSDCPGRTQRVPPTSNGCTIVPDNPTAVVSPACFVLGQAPSFTPACNGHDFGYDTCGRPKATTDNEFLDNMLATCDTVAEPCRSVCRVLAFDYMTVVSAIQGFYRDAQTNVCRCCALP